MITLDPEQLEKSKQIDSWINIKIVNLTQVLDLNNMFIKKFLQ